MSSVLCSSDYNHGFRVGAALAMVVGILFGFVIGLGVADYRVDQLQRSAIRAGVAKYVVTEGKEIHVEWIVPGNEPWDAEGAMEMNNEP